MTQQTSTVEHARYILIEATGAYWPGVLPYRSTGSRGYATCEAARARAYRVQCAYASRHGASGGPDLRVVQQERV